VVAAVPHRGAATTITTIWAPQGKLPAMSVPGEEMHETWVGWAWSETLLSDLRGLFGDLAQRGDLVGRSER